MNLELSPGNIARLREALAPFTVGAAFELLGANAHHALMRNETTPAERLTRGTDALSTLLRLFSLQRPVSVDAVRAALPELLEPLTEAGMIARDVDDVRALVDIRPYGDEDHDWWVVCDLTPNLDGGRGDSGSHGASGGRGDSVPRMRADHVLGINEASSSLARLAVREQNVSALDMGTGSGVQALHLAQHSQHVVATDINDRALRMARLTSELNGVEVDVRPGSLYEPVAGQTFDQIITNPPFVVSPPDGDKLDYRDSGFPGDEVVRRIIAGASDRLNPGGWCQILANWIHPRGGDWQERLHAWLDRTGLDAWVMQRERVDPASYIELWLADAGVVGSAAYTARYDAWLSWFEREGIEAIGFGWICLRKRGRDVPEIKIEHWSGPISGPLGPEISQWANGVDTLRSLRMPGERPDADLLEVHWKVAHDVVEESVRMPGADDPQSIVARRTNGVCRERELTTVEAGLLEACDGELSAGQISAALAELLGQDRLEVDTQIRSAVAEMVSDGILYA